MANRNDRRPPAPTGATGPTPPASSAVPMLPTTLALVALSLAIGQQPSRGGYRERGSTKLSHPTEGRQARFVARRRRASAPSLVPALPDCRTTGSPQTKRATFGSR